MNYNNGKIYKITDIAYTKMYIGSTTQSLSRRFSKHKANYKVWKDGKYGKSTSYDLFDEFGIENCKIELIEEYECENKSQLERKEGEHIKLNECVNKIVAGRTPKEYREDNKEVIKQYRLENKEKHKQYKEDNKDKLDLYQKEWREDNKDAIKAYREDNKEVINQYRLENKEKHKQYKEDNKDKLDLYQKEWREDNKDAIKAYQKEYRLAHKLI